jgi:hypothetical protein
MLIAKNILIDKEDKIAGRMGGQIFRKITFRRVLRVMPGMEVPVAKIKLGLAYKKTLIQ